jgi:hypothetical protein
MTGNTAAIKYVAEIRSVREVSLLGTADLAFWKDRLKNESLFPTARDGKAQLLIGATDAKFKGIRFREFTISLFVSKSEDATDRDGVFLVLAYNSLRLFAWVERTFFSTPYYFGKVQVLTDRPVCMEVRDRGEIAMRAEMSAGNSPVRSAEDGWSGPVFLPRKSACGKLFYARIGGYTDTYPFLPEQDTLTINPLPNSEVMRRLVESGFSATEWAVRSDAKHAKSKTYDRSSIELF